VLSIVIAVIAVIALVVGSGCTKTVRPGLIEDAQTAMRVKTVLVNDAAIGTRAIAVSVTRGVARLSGVVKSDEEAAHAVALARAVAGVVSVRADLQVRPGEPQYAVERDAVPRQEPLPAAPLASDSHRWLAVGVAVSPRYAADDRLQSQWSVGPLVRIGSGNGLAPAVAFNWFSADLAATGPSGAGLGHLRVKPVMAGVRYTVRRGRVSIDGSLVGGLAFNSFTLEAPQPGEPIPVSVGNSFAWRPGISGWYDATGRIALNVFAGYVVTRPRVTWLDDGRLTTRSVRGDTAVLSFGLAYKLF
jgi:hypothetical protein